MNEICVRVTNFLAPGGTSGFAPFICYELDSLLLPSSRRFQLGSISFLSFWGVMGEKLLFFSRERKKDGRPPCVS